MVKGYEQRGVITDPNLNTTTAGPQPNDLPMVQVQAPQPASMSGVGSGARELAALFSKGSGLMQQYFDQKKDQWRVDGQLAAAQGKTQAELTAAGGNEYTVQGYQATQASTALELWKQKKMIALTQGDEQKSPDQYRAELSQGFGEVMQGINDPYIKNLVAAHAERDLPQLMSHQMVQNATYVKEQTIKSATAQLGVLANSAQSNPAAEADLNDYIQTVHGTMRPDDAKEALTNAYLLGEESDNHQLTNALTGVNTKLPATATVDTSAPLNVRNNNPGNLRDANGTFRKYTTIEEGRAALEADLHAKIAGNSPAMRSKDKQYGTKPTLTKLINVYAPPSDNNPTGNYIDFVSKKIGVAPDQELTTANIASLATAMTQFEGGTGTPAVAAKMQQTTQTLNDLTASLLKQGFDAPQVEKMVAATKARLARVDSKFNAQQILDEEQLKSTAEQGTSLADSLQQMQQLADARGYGEKWKQGMAPDIVRAHEKGQVALAKTEKLQSAIDTNSIGLLSGSEQQEALAIAMKNDATLVMNNISTGVYKSQIEQSGSKKTEDQLAREDMQSRMLTRLVTNRVKSEVVGQQMKQSFRELALAKDSDIFDPKTNQLTPKGEQLIDNVGMYNALRSMPGSSIGFANSFINDDADALKIANAITAVDLSGSNLIPAVRTAVASLNQPQGAKPNPPSSEDISKAVAKDIDRNLNPGWIDYLFGGAANVGPFDVRDEQVAAWKKNNTLHNTAAALALDYVTTRNPNATSEEAANWAVGEAHNRGDYIAGNYILGPEGTTLKQLAGLGHVSDPLVMHQAVSEFMQDHGSNIYPDWDSAKVQLIARPDANAYKSDLAVGSAATAGALAGAKIGKFAGLPGLVGGAAIGAAIGMEQVGQGISPELVGQSLADLYKGSLPMNVQYDNQTQMLVITPYRNKEKTVPIGSPIPIPLSVIGEEWLSKHPPGTASALQMKATELAQPLLDTAASYADVLKYKSQMVGNAGSQLLNKLIK